MDLFEAVSTRRSYRGPFRYQQVPDRDLERIVQAGLDAPSAKNSQTTEFIIVTDQAIIQKIGALPEALKAMQTAPAMIVCVTDLQPSTVSTKETYEIENCAAAVENMLLALNALGYGSVWLDTWLRSKDIGPVVNELLKLPSYKTARVILPVGIPADSPDQPSKKPFESRVSYNTYGANAG